MDVIQKIDDLVKKLGQVSKDGIPLKHEVETKTVTEFGLWIVVGLVLCGAVAGTIIGLFNKRR